MLFEGGQYVESIIAALITCVLMLFGVFDNRAVMEAKLYVLSKQVKSITP